MDSNDVDTSRLPSRNVTEAPERASHRSDLSAIGLTDIQIHQPLAGVATSSIVTASKIVRRKAARKARETEYGSGAIRNYAQLVGPARLSALTIPGAQGEKECYADA